jgi:hypothetical protein
MYVWYATVDPGYTGDTVGKSGGNSPERNAYQVTNLQIPRHNPVVYQELNIDDDESLFASNIDFHDPTVIYFTAFLEQPDDGSGLSVREGEFGLLFVQVRMQRACTV